MPPPLPKATTNQVTELLDAGRAVRAISAELGVSVGFVSRVRKEHRAALPKAKGGRPRKLGENDVRRTARLIQSGEADTAVEVTKILTDTTNMDVSSQTICRALRKVGLRAGAKTKKPALKPRHKSARLDFAIEHQHWTMEDWKQVIWSDETKIMMKGSDGRKWVWKKRGEAPSDRTVQGTEKFGGGSLC